MINQLWIRNAIHKLFYSRIYLSPNDGLSPDDRLRYVEGEMVRWTKQCLGDLGGTWFILGAAPNPTVPMRVPCEWKFVCINNAGASEKARELRSPDITIRTAAKSWAEIKGSSTKALLLIGHESGGKWSSNSLDSLHYKASSTRYIEKADRDDLTSQILGWNTIIRIAAQRPSNGVFAALLASYLGAERIVLAGVSLRKQGHSYNSLGSARKHVDVDHKAIKSILHQKRILLTTEQDLSEDTGIPLIKF